MSDHPREGRDGAPDVFDEPFSLYATHDAVLRRGDGSVIDLNALVDPFTGDRPSATGAMRLRTTQDDETERAARQQLGRRLRVLRENVHLNKKDLAEQVGVSPAKITKVENGSSDAGLSLISAIVVALGAKLTDLVSRDAPDRSNPELIKLAVAAGVDPQLLRRLAGEVDPPDYPTALTRGFSWEREHLMAGELHSRELGFAPVFKAVGDPPGKDSPTLSLAWRLSTLATAHFSEAYKGVPQEPKQLRSQVRARYDDVDLGALLSWTWDAGVVVLPLRAKRDFIAAVWHVQQSPVIVLNESRSLSAYWLFDLAHELGHLALGHADQGIVEVDKPEVPDPTDRQEQQANRYALDVLLPDADQLVADVRRRTAGNAPKKFKFAVRDVASAAGVSPGVLGLIAANAMSDVPEDKDRWGSAMNLAKDEQRPDGATTTRQHFAARVEIDALDEIDAALLRAASMQG